MSDAMVLERAPTVEQIVEKLVEMLQAYTQTTTQLWDAATTMADVGIDSFDYVDFVFKIEDEFKIDVEFNANKGYSDLETIGDVARATHVLVLAKMH